MNLTFLILISYFLGSIPFGVIVARFFKIDITQHGSGNIGATNVLRTLGPVPGAIVLLLDLLKGTLATMIAAKVLNDPFLIIICGLAAVLGHMFSLLLGFKGGKGAAVGLGVLLAVAPDIFVATLALAIFIIAITRFVSLGSIFGSVFAAALMFFLGRPLPYAAATTLISALMIVKHIPNIKRLLSGTEKKIGEKNG
jgi:acyl phosphate:glycerol-3-phosphate acyltransferase